jgi:hypothetical protein
MAMTYAYYASVLKEFYGTAIQETFNNEVLLKKYLETSSKQIDGLRYVFPVHTARNAGIGARSEGGALPTAGQQSHASVYVTCAYNYARIDLTGQAMAASKKTAFAEALANEMEGAKTDLVFDVGRQTYGEGNGVLARGSTTTATLTSIYVANQYAAPGHPGARYVNVGAKLDLGVPSNPSAAASGLTVSVVTIAANSGTTYDTITVSTSGNMSASAYVFNLLAGGPGVEIKGLRAIIDDTTQTNCYAFTGGYFNNASIFNVDRNAVKGWNSYVAANSGTERILDSYLLQKTMSQVKKKSGKDIDIMFGEYDCIDAFWDSIAGDRRFTSKMFDAGVDTLTFNGKTMVKDLLAPYNEVFMLYKPALKWYVMQDLGFDDMSGEVLKNVTGYDRHEAFLKIYSQLASGEDAAPNACSVVRDIKVNL